jgi:hypothetical protein
MIQVGDLVQVQKTSLPRAVEQWVCQYEGPFEVLTDENSDGYVKLRIGPESRIFHNSLVWKVREKPRNLDKSEALRANKNRSLSFCARCGWATVKRALLGAPFSYCPCTESD